MDDRECMEITAQIPGRGAQAARRIGKPERSRKEKVLAFLLGVLLGLGIAAVNG